MREEANSNHILPVSTAGPPETKLVRPVVGGCGLLFIEVYTAIKVNYSSALK